MTVSRPVTITSLVGVIGRYIWGSYGNLAARIYDQVIEPLLAQAWGEGHTAGPDNINPYAPDAPEHVPGTTYRSGESITITHTIKGELL